MTDFQVAMIVMGSILTLFGLAFIAQARRSVEVAASAHGNGATPSGGAASAEELAAMRTGLAKTDSRLGEVEHHLAQVRTMLNALPSKDAVHRIEVEMAELKGSIKVNNVQTSATAKAVERIENWLMEEAKRKDTVS